jgi:hypothetical protein
MKKYLMRFAGAALLALFAGGLAYEAQADTGTVRVVFTKGGFIVGVGGGEGVLYFRGQRYPFTVSGMSVGFTIGASTTQFQGQALHLRTASDIQGSYSVIGGGGALAAGAGGVSLQNNQTGAVLQLAGGKIGVEVSASVGGVTIALK